MNMNMCEHSETLVSSNSKNTFTQPPPSVPTAAEHIPDATSAAGPEEDPPVYLSNECGFLAVLYKIEYKLVY